MGPHIGQNNQIMRDTYNNLHNKCNYIEESEHKRKRPILISDLFLSPQNFVSEDMQKFHSIEKTMVSLNRSKH